MGWRVQGAIQKALGYVPGGRRIHDQLQRRVSIDFGSECDVKVDDWRTMMGHLRACGVTVQGATLVEIGAGRAPTFPLCFYLAGAAHGYALDHDRTIDDELVRDLADRLMVHVTTIAATAGRPEPEVGALQRHVATALERGASLAVATGSVVDYRGPADPTATALPAGSVDIVFSASVLEHLPPATLERVFAEAMRVLRPGGVMVHSIHCGDHYADTDHRIDPLRYLRFSDEQWARWNNPFLYQNRLRAKDFVDLARAAGFSIEVEAPQRCAELDGIAVAPRFSNYSREELEVVDLDVVARKR